ncbi:MAG: hypothetical protein HZC28_19970 [Spirochaetes bacterium]|nr:hypothetical protein [Spirochaetota bacterium]
MSDRTRSINDVSVNTDSLYREETFTDLAVATIRKLSPVKADGTPDSARPTIFSGQTSIMTEMGSVPLSFEIDAKTLDEACNKYPAAMRKAFDDMMNEIREMRREQASRIVVPGAGGAQQAPRIQLK